MDISAACGIERVVVSREMVAILGSGDAGPAEPSGGTAAILFTSGGVGTRASLRIFADARDAPVGGWGEVALLVEHAALARLFDWTADAADHAAFHLTSALREIVLALRDRSRPAAALGTYRLAKSIELLCESVQALQGDALIPVADDSALSSLDSSRVVAARRMIDERWDEKLTLSLISRSCGLNRAKLTRGFRELYRCTVSEAIAERRLAEAGRKLLTTDLPVSTIGYQSGYLSNASFTRAFGRRFGVTPSDYRNHRLAA